MASPASAPAASARVHRVVRPARSPTRPRARVAPRARAASSSSSDRDGAAAKEGPVVVAVVTTASCPHCRRAKAAIAAAGIAFEEIDASAPDGVVLDAARKLSGMRTVPQVFVGRLLRRSGRRGGGHRGRGLSRGGGIGGGIARE